MKKTSFLALLWACAASLIAQDVTYNKTVDEIWGGRVFMELNGQYAGVSRKDAGIAWPTNDKTVMVYCLRVPRMNVRADAVFTPKAGRTVTFNLRVVKASTGEVITEHTSQMQCKTSLEQTMEIMPDLVFPADTWYRFEITCPKCGNSPNCASNVNQRWPWAIPPSSWLPAYICTPMPPQTKMPLAVNLMTGFIRRV